MAKSRYGMLLHVLLLAALVFNSVAARQHVVPHSPSPGLGSIFGTVRDSVTGEALPGAIVVLDSTSLGATVDSQGHFDIQRIPPGIYMVKTKCIGYDVNTRAGVQVFPSQPTELHVLLKEWTYRFADQARAELARGVVELWVGGLVITAIPDSSLTDKYGFRFLVSGCDPIVADIHNEPVEAYLERRNGKDWRDRLNAEWKSMIHELERKQQNR